HTTLFRSKSRSIVAPGVSPLPALLGTVLGMDQLPPPVALHSTSGPHCAGVRPGLVQPIVSKPLVPTSVRTPTTPTSAPNRSHVLLATSAARPPRSSALLLSIACAVYVKFSPSRSNGRALRMFTVPAAPPSSIDADG